jgi:hypothetical protein
VVWYPRLERTLVGDVVLVQQVLHGRACFQGHLDHFALELLAVPGFELAVRVVLELAFHGSLFGVNPFHDGSPNRNQRGLATGPGHTIANPGPRLRATFHHILSNAAPLRPVFFTSPGPTCAPCSRSSPPLCPPFGQLLPGLLCAWLTTSLPVDSLQIGWLSVANTRCQRSEPPPSTIRTT